MAQPDRVGPVVDRVYALADEPLEGIEEAAREIASLCDGDLSIIDAVRRDIHAATDAEPSRRNKQAMSLVRRALEVGQWDWEAYESGAPSVEGPHGSVIAAIAVGGAAGAPARYGVGQLIHVAPGTFPWATFTINVSGSLALGLLLGVLVERLPAARHVRALLATGFLGAYTTYSTFAVDTDVLVKDGHTAVAAAYVAASVLLGLAAAWIGLQLARRTVGARP